MNAKDDYFFGTETDFIALWKADGKWHCKPYLDLTETELHAMMFRSGRWRHFKVERDDQGNVTVVHTRTSTVRSLGGYRLPADQAEGMSDVEIVWLSQQRLVAPSEKRRRKIAA